MKNDTITDGGWNHNTHYHDLLLKVVPRPCPRALDAGCGLGEFARRLSRLAGEVDAIDSEPAVIARARQLSPEIRNLHFAEAGFLTWPEKESYDFLSMIAVLHHLPFAEALTRAATMLRPGGVLAVLGLDRPRTFLHRYTRSAIAYPVSIYYRCTRRTATVGAPIREPSMTYVEIRKQATELLPGAIARRHLLWRYSLVWTKPAGSPDL